MKVQRPFGKDSELRRFELRLTGASGMDRGYTAFDFPSSMVATGGVEFAARWVVLDPVTLQFATTARYEFRVQ